MSDYDVVVAGAGNAALAAANATREQGAERVLVLEKCPRRIVAATPITAAICRASPGLFGDRGHHLSPIGALKIDENTRVIGADWRPIKGLFACGEMVGGRPFQLSKRRRPGFGRGIRQNCQGQRIPRGQRVIQRVTRK